MTSSTRAGSGRTCCLPPMAAAMTSWSAVPATEAEQATTAATIHKLETILPVIQSRVDIRKTLVEKELGSKLSYFEVFQLLVEQQEQLGVQKNHLLETEAAIAAIRKTRAQAAAEYRHTYGDCRIVPIFMRASTAQPPS